jgi:hypothetical protein
MQEQEIRHGYRERGDCAKINEVDIKYDAPTHLTKNSKARYKDVIMVEEVLCKDSIDFIKGQSYRPQIVTGFPNKEFGNWIINILDKENIFIDSSPRKYKTYDEKKDENNSYFSIDFTKFSKEQFKNILTKLDCRLCRVQEIRKLKETRKTIKLRSEINKKY